MLSGLLNRRAFQRAFDDGKGDVSLVLFDIDRFKTINDTFGHSVGDEVIAAVAEVIREGFGDSEVCARIGGEEFAVLWPASGVETITERAEHVRRRVAALDFPCNGRRVKVTISGGVADLPNGRSFNEIFSEADRALYVAKAGGRDRIVSHRDIDSLSTGMIMLPTALAGAEPSRRVG